MFVGTASIDSKHDRDILHVSNLEKSYLEFRELPTNTVQEVKDIYDDLALSDTESDSTSIGDKDEVEEQSDNDSEVFDNARNDDFNLLRKQDDNVSKTIDSCNGFSSEWATTENNNSCEINSTGDAEIIQVKKKKVVNLKELMIPYPDKPDYAKCKLCFQNGDERILSKKSFSRHVKRFHLNNGNAFSYSIKGVFEVQQKKDVKLRHLKGKKEVGYLKNKLNLKQCPKLFMKQIVKVHKINPKIFKVITLNTNT